MGRSSFANRFAMQAPRPGHGADDAARGGGHLDGRWVMKMNGKATPAYDADMWFGLFVVALLAAIPASAAVYALLMSVPSCGAEAKGAVAFILARVGCGI